MLVLHVCKDAKSPTWPHSGSKCAPVWIAEAPLVGGDVISSMLPPADCCMTISARGRLQPPRPGCQLSFLGGHALIHTAGSKSAKSSSCKLKESTEKRTPGWQGTPQNTFGSIPFFHFTLGARPIGHSVLACQLKCLSLSLMVQSTQKR